MSVGKMNFTRSGNSSPSANCAPRHSEGIARHASRSVLPRNSEVATRQSSPVSQASPSGSARFDFSGKSGASDRAPQMRGLKIGSSRWGAGFKLSSGLSPREEAIETAQPFVDALDRGGVGKAQISGRAERIARHERNARFVE